MILPVPCAHGVRGPLALSAWECSQSTWNFPAHIVTFTATADVNPPKPGPATRGPQTPGLSVLVVDGGVSIKAAGGNVAPGCHDTGTGLAVGKASGDYDFGALQKCALALKASPDFASKASVTISANPGVRYETVIATMDALRQTADGADLFPDVALGVGH